MRKALGLRHTLLAPSLTVFLVLFVVPTGYFFVISFWQVRAYRLRQEWTVEQYITVVTEFAGVLGYTLLIAVTIALITTSIAYAYAYYCRFKAGRYGLVFVFIAVITLFGGYLSKIYMWKTILGSSGILNSAVMMLGLVDEPFTVFLFSPFAVIITLTHYTLPLAILPIYGAMRGIDTIPLKAATDLGARPWRVFFDIVLPQSKVGLISSFSLTFIFAAGDYVTPLMVGGPHTSMIGLFIQSQFGHKLDPPLGSAMSFTVIASCFLIIGLFALVVHWLTRQRVT